MRFYIKRLWKHFFWNSKWEGVESFSPLSLPCHFRLVHHSHFIWFQIITMGNLRGKKNEWKKEKVFAKGTLQCPTRISVTPHCHWTHKKLTPWLYPMLALVSDHLWENKTCEPQSGLSTEKDFLSPAQHRMHCRSHGKRTSNFAQSHTKLLTTDTSCTSLALSCLSAEMSCN